MKSFADSFPVRALSFALFTLLLVGTMAFFVKVFSAEPYNAPPPVDRSYDRTAMDQAISTEAVRARYDEIMALGSRAPGQEGLEKAAELIERTFREAGLEVFSQRVDIPYALCEGGHGTMSVSGGEGVELIDVWPFKPNFAQPVATPDGGTQGELFLVNEGNIRSATSFKDKIAVIDMAQPLIEQLGVSPGQYRELGFQAIVLTHSSGLESIPWDTIVGSISINMPANLIRVAAGPEVLDHIGQKATIKSRSMWVDARTRNVIGVMRAAKPSDRALVIPVTYDASSLLPDMAGGSVQAFQTAIMLQLVQGLAAQRGALERDVVFIATTGMSQSLCGSSRLLSTIGDYGKNARAKARIEADIAMNDRRRRNVESLLALFDDPAFGVDTAATEAVAKGLPSPLRKFLNDRVGAVTRKAVFDQAEVQLQAEIAYKRHPDDLDSPEYHLFRREKKLYDDLNNMSALPYARAITRKVAQKRLFSMPDGSQAYLRDAIVAHLRSLIAFHEERDASLQEDLALYGLFARYASFVGISPHLQPAEPDADAEEEEQISYAVGNFELNQNSGEAAQMFYSMLTDAVYALGLQDEVTIQKPNGTWPYFGLVAGATFDSTPWGVISLPVFSVCSPTHKSRNVGTPFAQPAFTNLSSVAKSLRVVGELASAAGRGGSDLPRMPIVKSYQMHGTVYASGVGNSVVPNYAVPGALVADKESKPYIITDPYGEYNVPFMTMPSYGWARWTAPYAFLFGPDGTIRYVKDFGSTAQKIYASEGMPISATPLNFIIYRGSPVSVLDMVNPQSMKAYTGIQFMKRVGLSTFSSTCPFISPAGRMDFIPPGERFFLALKAGAPGNELVATTRAFCLGTLHNGEPHYHPTDNEIDGAGYLAQDTEFFPDITLEAAASMDWLAAKRLDLQNRYRMADEMTLALDEESGEMIKAELAEAKEDGAVESGTGPRPALARLRSLRTALSYLILNHPVIRGSISEAVWGILWYMGLLVPFIFFFEKLVFGFTDVRKQLMAEGITFLIVFCLLRILHPAFHMIRSSAMILLGFIIILIVGSVTIVLSGKFQENMDALRRSQGGVKGAHVNKGGIMMTAFMLGLNNMHRRKVRTGLTCATLVLMTFVMICFTSVQSDIVEKETAIGRATYQGILVRNRMFRPIADAEIAALHSSYDENHAVCVRRAAIGLRDFWSGTQLPNYKVVHGEGDEALSKIVKCSLTFSSAEPLAKSIRLLSTNGWFTAEQELAIEGPHPVILPDDVAESLGITPADVDAAPVPVTISGTKYFVWNIFETSSFASVTDIDGKNLLPFDVEAMTTPVMEQKFVLAEDTDPRVQPSDVLIGLNGKLDCANPMMMRATSVVVDMGASPYQVARAEIGAYLIQTGRDTSYGLDGTAFSGRRARARSMAGLADLLIPLIIAALTVLNTMKGSVYERRDEIYVYNAVGIAPRYIFFIFVAEALVYSVVGAVLGYILSQGTGRILTALDMTGGMNMNFTSATTIYASLAIGIATLASTYFPAKSAMEIAKPADNAGWTLPAPDSDDRIVFMLPFTFTRFDRIAVLAFFHKYFDNLGEGSAGPFFAGTPVLKIADHTDPLADDAYIPCLEVQVWLKPFDLGVSQKITIELGTDPETKEFISKMILERMTGTRDAWLRLNGPMVALIRQHFLHWRAVPQDQKEELFAEAKALREESAT